MSFSNYQHVIQSFFACHLVILSMSFSHSQHVIQSFSACHSVILSMSFSTCHSVILSMPFCQSQHGIQSFSAFTRLFSVAILTEMIYIQTKLGPCPAALRSRYTTSCLPYTIPYWEMWRLFKAFYSVIFNMQLPQCNHKLICCEINKGCVSTADVKLTMM